MRHQLYRVALTQQYWKKEITFLFKNFLYMKN
jgi:hypothetical protein